MIEERQRLTVDKAIEMMQKYNVTKLRGGHWIVPANIWKQGDNWHACPTGLLLIDKCGSVEDAAEKVRSTYYSISPAINPVPGVARMIAEKTELPDTYVYGLNDGFEDNPSFALLEDQDYLKGLDDGTLLKEKT